ncbi:gag/polymerase/env polyprotein, putative [Talaromyces stipitatus ATCC 10500]|uniref:Gag/polymerase/env polyprotein, putative n=1 Tax=Talaromyces stipitatus (strain ATCC 10500 / CBS 375.48 / QM 6759 / NRRL 1006) TaxID=441959 RepID=B8MN78_TALSN|nr:gag/polymerase/env polyprotein, putative [Talaromyces stipitatus ATCC 10500]EED14527.1 gag/polymerase/env polyprotein, putative [Talaromyces stipitatus ATCC 10500]
MLAIVGAFKHWRHYLKGTQWCYYLTSYDFVIKWRSGSTNPADALSRRPDYIRQNQKDDPEDSSLRLLMTLGVKIARVQQICTSYRRRVMQSRDNENPQGSEEEKTCKVSEESTQASEKPQDMVTCVYDSESGRQVQVCPGPLGPSCVLTQKVTRQRARQAVLNEAPRQEPSEGLRQLVAAAQMEDAFYMRVDKDLSEGDSTRLHYGCTSDGVLLYKGRILVPNQRSLVHEILRLHHDEPSARHWGIQKTLDLLQRKFKWEGMRQDVEEYLSRPWKEISMDFITQLPVSKVGTEEYNTILTVVDRYTKMAIFLPVQDTIDAAEMAELLHKEVELRYGCPSGIVSDRDSRITTAFTYNNSMNHTLCVSPFKALYGFDPEFHIDVADNVLEGEIPTAKDHIQKLHKLRQGLRDQLNTARQRQIEYYNKRHTPKTFKRGSLVKLSTRNLKLKNKKLQPRFVGPFRITEVIGSQAYRLALPQQYSRLHDVFLIQLLKEYHPRKKQEIMPLPELEDNPEEYKVEEIQDKRMIKGKVHYLIKWTGWPSEYNQWIPEDDMNAPRLIQGFKKSRKRKRR